MTPTQILEVQLTVQDPSAAGRWYAETLGLHLTSRRTLTGDQVEIQAGSTRLVLVPGPTGPGVHHLAFTVPKAGYAQAVDDLACRVELITVDGHSVFEGPEHWNSSSVYFRGPDGALLKYIVRRDLPDGESPDAGLPDKGRTSRVVPGGAATGISEVGVAVPDVAALVRALQAELGLAPFGPPSPAFAAVGDQHGVLVCVSADRRWYPQRQQLPVGGPLRVQMAIPRGTAELVRSRDGTVHLRTTSVTGGAGSSWSASSQPRP